MDRRGCRRRETNMFVYDGGGGGAVMGTERSPVTHGFGLEEPNTDTDNYILWSSLLFSYE